MNPLLLQFANGRAFFLGMAMVVVGTVAKRYARGRVLGSLIAVGAILGVVFVALSATPLPIWAYAIWSVALGVALLTPNEAAPRGRLRRTHRVAPLGLSLLSISLCLWELPYQLAPRIGVRPGQTIYVLGDSISAGLGGRERCWPEVLGDRSGYKVVNLAEPGARLAHGLRQAGAIAAADSLVLVELGGNDLLGDADSARFAEELDELLGSLRARGCQAAMFELPLPPLANAFGAAQRRLAAKHGVFLIPKRMLTAVLGTPGATLDGLHLSQEGHDRLAQRVLELLESSGPASEGQDPRSVPPAGQGASPGGADGSMRTARA